MVGEVGQMAAGRAMGLPAVEMTAASVAVLRAAVAKLVGEEAGSAAAVAQKAEARAGGTAQMKCGRSCF